MANGKLNTLAAPRQSCQEQDPPPLLLPSDSLWHQSPPLPPRASHDSAIRRSDYHSALCG